MDHNDEDGVNFLLKCIGIDEQPTLKQSGLSSLHQHIFRVASRGYQAAGVVDPRFTRIKTCSRYYALVGRWWPFNSAVGRYVEYIWAATLSSRSFAVRCTPLT